MSEPFTNKKQTLNQFTKSLDQVTFDIVAPALKEPEEF